MERRAVSPVCRRSRLPTRAAFRFPLPASRSPLPASRSPLPAPRSPPAQRQRATVAFAPSPRPGARRCFAPPRGRRAAPTIRASRGPPSASASPRRRHRVGGENGPRRRNRPTRGRRSIGLCRELRTFPLEIRGPSPSASVPGDLPGRDPSGRDPSGRDASQRDRFDRESCGEGPSGESPPLPPRPPGDSCRASPEAASRRPPRRFSAAGRRSPRRPAGQRSKPPGDRRLLRGGRAAATREDRDVAPGRRPAGRSLSCQRRGATSRGFAGRGGRQALFLAGRHA